MNRAHKLQRTLTITAALTILLFGGVGFGMALNEQSPEEPLLLTLCGSDGKPLKIPFLPQITPQP